MVNLAKYCQFILLGVILLLLGCSGTKPTTVVPKNADNAAENNADSGRNLILQMPFDKAAELVMKNIGYAYRLSLAGGSPPANAKDLDAGKLATMRDMKEHAVEVLYGVNPSKLPDGGAGHMLAWEKEPTNDGRRMVLMADCMTVKYMSEEEFSKTPKAK
jgi:hypothetical protein